MESAPKCPVHNTTMVLEDLDSAYGQGVWMCRRYSEGCDEVGYTGPSDSDIYRREYAG